VRIGKGIANILAKLGVEIERDREQGSDGASKAACDPTLSPKNRAKGWGTEG